MLNRLPSYSHPNRAAHMLDPVAQHRKAIKDSSGYTSLMCAAERGDVEAVRALAPHEKASGVTRKV